MCWRAWGNSTNPRARRELRDQACNRTTPAPGDGVHMDEAGVAPGASWQQKIQEKLKLLNSCCPSPTPQLVAGPSLGASAQQALKAAKIRCLQMGKCRMCKLQQSAQALHPMAFSSHHAPCPACCSLRKEIQKATSCTCPGTGRLWPSKGPFIPLLQIQGLLRVFLFPPCCPGEQAA